MHKWLLLLLVSAATLRVVVHPTGSAFLLPAAGCHLFTGPGRPLSQWHHCRALLVRNPYGKGMPVIIAALDLQALIGLPDGPTVGYLRLHYFSSEGTTAFTDALRFGEFYGVAGWLIDLRNNPGKRADQSSPLSVPLHQLGTCKYLWCSKADVHSAAARVQCDARAPRELWGLLLIRVANRFTAHHHQRLAEHARLQKMHFWLPLLNDYHLCDPTSPAGGVFEEAIATASLLLQEGQEIAETVRTGSFVDNVWRVSSG